MWSAWAEAFYAFHFRYKATLTLNLFPMILEVVLLGLAFGQQIFPISTNSQCGVAAKARCPNSQCCSQFGWCGVTDEHCKAGCQAPFGSCSSGNSGGNTGGGNTFPESKDFTCGPIVGLRCPSNFCCSEFGFCGTDSNYCGAKCQKLFGKCTDTSGGNPPLSTTPPPISSSSRASVITKCTRPGLFALTYDDGPSQNIPTLLAKLAQLNVKATFFINANNFAKFDNPSSADAKLVRSIFDSGHQIGTHTYSHVDLGTAGIQLMWDQMRLNDEAISRIIGQRPTHLRPPFLSTSSSMLDAMGSWGYKVISINMDTKDFSFTGRNAVRSMQNLVFPTLRRSNIRTDSFISLNHDFTGSIVAWTESFVREIQAKGFKLVTVAECIGDSNPYRS
jgi:peptidoglycan/xylan/chitin deacetylase (PgdA/CDA1 family)